MAVDSSAWWPGGRTTAKPFWFKNRRRAGGHVRRRRLDLIYRKPEKVRRGITLSSPAATLKASSMTEPTAMRTAADECISFQTVSLSTCVGGGSTEIKLSHTDHMHGDETDRLRRDGSLTPMPPQGRTAYIFWLIGPETANEKRSHKSVVSQIEVTERKSDGYITDAESE